MKTDEWLNSKEAKKLAKIQDCDLTHHREAGKISFTKKGNAFMYKKDDLIKLKK